ncbi:hypothetical protein N7468_005689 [Penicillium chermesinum]|uniref:Clock-controlled protein 6 n=1 Tax=Penicillium chermesinum TaxID=63820 RepID=A0A9W9TNM5_9EURO|nr:uncharacterized protein N7468_005689 [Penicillium chermesinum]KAJ5232733.1 hypothetical protein N7468_005689 [Penicillium chermesinum]KAJ6172393.1 hypothetical protein N7470_001460 [Penicillium chermesinum]
MRFSLAAVAFAVGAVASQAVTETLTDYTTYCPEATTISYGSHTYSISTPGHITLTNGPYTVTRPLITQTVTQCNKCSSSTPIPTTPVSIPVSIPAGSATSTPLIPSGAGPTGVPPAASSQPAFNAGAVNAATGAGAGLAAVFGVAALLL